MAEYPESEKLASEEMAIVLDFLAFLRDEHYRIEHPEREEHTQKIVYRFFDVDEKKLEKERQEMIGAKL